MNQVGLVPATDACCVPILQKLAIHSQLVDPLLCCAVPIYALLAFVVVTLLNYSLSLSLSLSLSIPLVA